MRILHRAPTLVWVLFLVVAVSAINLSAQADDPLIGTWKLNVEKSKYSPGPPPQSLTVTYAPSGEGIEVTTEGVNAEGAPTSTHYMANLDGKDYPITGSPTADMVSSKRIDRYTTERTEKKDGKTTVTIRRVVSRDGKTLTITSRGTNLQGQAVSTVSVFEKQ
jgi:hypothetical protein